MRGKRENGGEENGSEARQPKVISHFLRLLVQDIYSTASSVVRNYYFRARKIKERKKEKTLVVCLLLKIRLLTTTSVTLEIQQLPWFSEITRGPHCPGEEEGTLLN